MVKLLPKYIYLPTPQSSGTWWAIDALRKHPMVQGAVSHVNLLYHHNNWALVDGWKDNPHNESLASDLSYYDGTQVTLIFSHYGGIPGTGFNRWRPQNGNEWMMQVLPSLSPLRDPLIGMIRAWHREPMLYPHDYIMNNYLHIAQRGNTLGVNFWRMEPFDYDGFFNAVEAVGLPLLEEWLMQLNFNKRINDTPGECDLREDYKNGDIKAIAKKLPIPWRRLTENEPVFRPFLESYGFKDLLWWS